MIRPALRDEQGRSSVKRRYKYAEHPIMDGTKRYSGVITKGRKPRVARVGYSL